MNPSINPFKDIDVTNLKKINEKFDDAKVLAGYGKVKHLKPEQKLAILQKIYKIVVAKDPAISYETRAELKQIQRIAKHVVHQAAKEKKALGKKEMDTFLILFGKSTSKEKLLRPAVLSYKTDEKRKETTKMKILDKDYISYVSEDKNTYEWKSRLDKKIETEIKNSKDPKKNKKFNNILLKEFDVLEKNLKHARGYAEVKENKIRADILKEKAYMRSRELTKSRLLKMGMNLSDTNPADVIERRYATFYEEHYKPKWREERGNKT
jgi:hypothetical protein